MGILLKRLFRALGRGLGRLLNARMSVKFVVILLGLAIAGTWMLTSSNMKKEAGDERDYDEAIRYIEVKDILEKQYIDDVDRSRLAQSSSAAMVSSLGDRWSYYMTEDEYQTYQLSSTNEATGAGLSTVKQSGGFQVTMVNPESAAARAGLVPGMVITGVDGTDVSKMDADEFRTLIRSRLNGRFTLNISGQRDPVEIDCGIGYVSPVSYSIERTGAGYIKISSFEAGTGEAVKDAFESLLNQKVTKFIVDIRDNPGGLVGELQLALDYLLPQGELFSLRSKDGTAESFSSDNNSMKAEICVLVNAQTFGEAEIFAAVLQESRWARIIGEPTVGRTRIQQTIELSDGSAIRLSTKSYVTEAGTDISAVGGVKPDITVYNTDAGEASTEGNGMASYADDPQLRTALEQLSIGFSS